MGNEKIPVSRGVGRRQDEGILVCKRFQVAPLHAKNVQFAGIAMEDVGISHVLPGVKQTPASLVTTVATKRCMQHTLLAH